MPSSHEKIAMSFDTTKTYEANIDDEIPLSVSNFFHPTTCIDRSSMASNPAQPVEEGWQKISSFTTWALVVLMSGTPCDSQGVPVLPGFTPEFLKMLIAKREEQARKMMP